MGLNFSPRQAKVSERNTLVRDHTIPVKIRKFFTDVNGAILAKSAVASNLQTKYPVYLLGGFDKEGGYRIGQKIVSPSSDVRYLMSFVNGQGCTPSNIIGFTGLDEISGQIKIGDIVSVYVDSFSSVTTFIWIVVGNDYAAMGSIIGNSESTQKDFRLGQVFIYEINYFIDNEAQLNEPLHFTRTDNIGTYSDNQVQPTLFKNPYVAQEDFIRMEIQFKLDQYLGVYFNMLHDCDQLGVNFKIRKIN